MFDDSKKKLFETRKQKQKNSKKEKKEKKKSNLHWISVWKGKNLKENRFYSLFWNMEVLIEHRMDFEIDSKINSGEYPQKIGKISASLFSKF